MTNDHLAEARRAMEEVLGVVLEDLALVRTGRAKPSLVETIMIPVYNTRMSLRELATISAPEPHLLVIQPWDETVVQDIAKGIAASEMGLTPVVDGSLIRIQIPPLTEERREEYVKLVHQKLESGRILLRQARQDAKKKIEDLKGQPGVSEDDIHRLLGELETLTDEYIEKVEEMGRVKEEELRTI